MKPPKDRKDQYAVVSPATKSSKYLVCSRRIGSAERLTPIAECRSESIATHIVEGLHLRQKELVKLAVPAEKQVEDLKAQLARERTQRDDLSLKLRDEQRRIGLIIVERDRAIRERDAAQAKAREEA
jgi:hypothetical protein